MRVSASWSKPSSPPTWPTTLSGPGPFTVFAPTNDAFAALLTELGVTKAQLLADKPLLTAVLHVPRAVGHGAQGRRCRWARPITPLQGGIFKVDSRRRATWSSPTAATARSKITATDVAGQPTA